MINIEYDAIPPHNICVALGFSGSVDVRILTDTIQERALEPCLHVAFASRLCFLVVYTANFKVIRREALYKLDGIGQA